MQVRESEIKVPCHRCNDRHVSCHSNCDKYTRYKRVLDELHTQKNKEKPIIDYYVSRKRG